MNTEIHRKVLDLAKEGGYLSNGVPTDDVQLAKLAEYYRVEAHKAHKAGLDDEYITKILKVCEGYSTLYDNSLEFIRDISNEEEKKELEKYDLVVKNNDKYSSPEVLAESENMFVPSDITDKLSEMPRDLTSLSDLKIRKLYGEFNNYMCRAKWLLAIETSDLANATHIREDFYRNALQQTSKVDEETGKAKVKDIIDAEAKETEEYREWDEKVHQHNMACITWKALVDIYNGNVTILSREMTFRREAWEKER